MTVAIDARYDPETGVGRYVAELRRALQQTGRHRYLFLRRNGRGFGVIRVRSKPFSLLEQLEVPLLLAVERPRVLHVPHFLIPILWPGPVIVTVQDVIPLDFPDSLSSRVRWLYPSMLRIACDRAARIIVPSAATRDELIRRGLAGPDRVTVTPYAAPTLEEAFGPTLVQGRYVLCVALLRRHKNLQVLIRALAGLSEHSKDLKLVIVGEGPERKTLARLSEDLRVADRVMLLGRLPDAAIAGLYLRASILVAPSLAEGFGLTVLEAMARGLPVITSTAAALVETAAGAALSFDPYRAEELSAQIERVLDDDGLQVDLRARGMQRVRAFSWAQMADATEQVYDSVLNR